MNMLTVVIVRPGESQYDLEERVQGRLDLPLTKVGELQRDADTQQLSRLPINQIYTSPSEPALSSARHLGEALDVSVKSLAGLENMSLGLWEGMCIDEIRRKHPKVFRQWQEAPDFVCPPQGETSAEVVERVGAAMRKPLKRKGTIAVVCPEPLATLMTCVLRGEPVRFPRPGRSRDAERIVMIGLPAAASVAGLLWAGRERSLAGS